MNAAAAQDKERRSIRIWLFVGIGLLLILSANAHLVYVAVTSQPSCVAHIKPGNGDTGHYSAARSSCSN